MTTLTFVLAILLFAGIPFLFDVLFAVVRVVGEHRRSLSPRIVLLSALTFMVLGTGAAYAGGLMFPPANKGYSYQTAEKPACSSASHAYLGWGWMEAPSGASTYTRPLVCTSSQGGVAGYGWRALVLDSSLVN